jgi:hypothetical protein
MGVSIYFAPLKIRGVRGVMNNEVRSIHNPRCDSKSLQTHSRS